MEDEEIQVEDTVDFSFDEVIPQDGAQVTDEEILPFDGEFTDDMLGSYEPKGETLQEYTGTEKPDWFMGDEQEFSDIPADESNQYRDYKTRLTEGLESYGMGKTGELPEPTTDMYEKSGDTYKLYKQYINNPKTTRSPTGEYIYKNTVVPFPEDGDVSARQMTQFGTRGVIKNVMKKGAALIDSVAGTTLAKQVDENIADRPTSENTWDNIVMQGTEIALGAVAGYAVGSKTASKNDFSDKAAKAVAGLSSMIGAGAAQDENTDTLITGPNAMVRVLKGLPPNEDDPYHEKVLKGWYNVVMDEFTGGRAAELGIAGAAKAINLVKNITVDQFSPYLSRSSREGQAINELIATLGLENKDQVKQLREVLEKHKDVFIRIADSDIDNINMRRTTMSAIEEGNKDTLLGERAMEMEQGATKRGTTQLQRQIEEPVRKLNTLEQQAVESRGGTPTIEAARENIATGAREELGQIRGMPEQQDEALRLAEEEVRDLLRNDPTFGEVINRMEKSSGVNILQDKTDATSSVIRGMTNAVRNMIEAKNQLYDAIPDDALVDFDSFNKIFMDSPRDAKGMPELGRYIPKAMDIITDPNRMLDFKTLNNEVLPEVNAAISRMVNSDSPLQMNPDILRSLQEIKKNINQDQIQYLMKNGDPETVRVANAAYKYYTEDFLPFQQDGTPTAKLFDAYYDAYLGKGKIIPEAQKYGYNQKTRDIVEGLKDKKIDYSRQVLDLLSRPEADKDLAEKVVSVYLGDVAAKFSQKLSEAGGIDKINPKDIMGTTGLGKIGVLLEERFPDQAARINSLVDNLSKAKGNAKLQEEISKQIHEEALKAEETLFGSVLGKFIEKDATGGVYDTTNAYNTFKNILNQNGNERQIKEIANRVRLSGDPVAQKGLESAYFTYLRDSLQQGAKNFNMANAEDFLSDTSSLWQYGQDIFGNTNPEVLEGYKAAVQFVVGEQAKQTGKQVAPEGATKIGERAAGAFNLAVNFTLGVLNPTATKVRSTGGRIIKRFDPSANAIKILDKMYADPDYTINLLKKIEKSDWFNYSDEAKSNIWRFGIYTGIYGTEDEKKFDEEWQLKKQEAQQEEGLVDQATRAVGTIEQDMENLLNGR